MNDALRLLARLLRQFGYDIKRHHQYNLLPIARIKDFNSIATLYRNNTAGNDSSAARLDQLIVYLRVCLQTAAQKNRPENFAATGNAALVFGCVQSLIASINHALAGRAAPGIRLVVLDDHSDAEYRQEMEKICAACNAQVEIRTTRKRGQGASLFEQFDLARSENALCYFCEDDYLHIESAITEMYHFYRQVFEICGTHSILHPQEHEFLYTRYVYPSYILLGEHRHWRTISHATHTLFMHADLVAKHWQYFENTQYVGDKKNRRLGVESRTTNHLFEHYPGFAPIPAVAAHMQTLNSLPPFFEWQGLWDRHKPDRER